MQGAGWLTGNTGSVHGHIQAGLGRTEANASREQGPIVRKRATNQERYGLFGPIAGAVRHVFGQDAIAINGVSLDIYIYIVHIRQQGVATKCKLNKPHTYAYDSPDKIKSFL
jgi:hypothetical protein